MIAQLLQIAPRASKFDHGRLTGRGRVRFAARMKQAGKPAGVVRGTSAPVEGLKVLFDLNIVQRNGPLQGFPLKRYPAFLPGVSDHDGIGVDRITQQALRKLGRINRLDAARAAGLVDIVAKVCARHAPVWIADERGRGRHV